MNLLFAVSALGLIYRRTMQRSQQELVLVYAVISIDVLYAIHKNPGIAMPCPKSCANLQLRRFVNNQRGKKNQFWYSSLST